MSNLSPEAFRLFDACDEPHNYDAFYEHPGTAFEVMDDDEVWVTGGPGSSVVGIRDDSLTVTATLHVTRCSSTLAGHTHHAPHDRYTQIAQATVSLNDYEHEDEAYWAALEAVLETASKKLS